MELLPYITQYIGISRMSDPDPGKTTPDPNPRFSFSIVSVLWTIFPFKEQSSSMNLTFLHSLRGVTVGLFLGLQYTRTENIFKYGVITPT